MSVLCLPWFLLMPMALGYQTDVVFPWVTQNDQFHSQIAINNPHNLGATVKLEATRVSDGGLQAANTQLVLNPFANVVFDVADAFPDFAPGRGFMVRLTSTARDLQAGFVVNARSTASGSSPAQANVRPVGEASQVLLFNHLPASSGGFAAPVVTNLGDADTLVTFTAYRADVVVARAERTVAAETSFAEGLQTLFPEVAGDLYVIAQADQPLVGVSFLFNAIGEPSMASAVGLGSAPGLNDEVMVSTLASDIGIVDAVSYGPDGNLYVSDFLGGQDFANAAGRRILQITPEGEISTYTDGVVTPLGHAWDSQGNLYVSSFTEGNIRRVAPDKTVSILASGFNGPSGVAVDSNDHIYVAQYNEGHTINKITPEGVVSVFVNDPVLNGPVGISFDENNQLYIGNYNDGKVFRTTPTGDLSQITQVVGPGFFTMGYLTYANGYIYATGIGKNLVYRISLDGEVSVLAGSGASALADGSASEAAFFNPNGIAANTDGTKLYISSFSGRVLRMIELVE